jgi:transcriptional regulator with XRE-family HTH domain
MLSDLKYFKYFCLKLKKQMKIGHKLKGLRIEKGFSTTKVAEDLGISETTYRRYETDKSFPDIFVLDKIAKMYDKNFSDILPEGITIINNNSGEYYNAAYIINQSEKLTDQYEARIKDLQDQNKQLWEQINFYRNIAR